MLCVCMCVRAYVCVCLRASLSEEAGLRWFWVCGVKVRFGLLLLLLSLVSVLWAPIEKKWQPPYIAQWRQFSIKNSCFILFYYSQCIFIRLRRRN